MNHFPLCISTKIPRVWFWTFALLIFFLTRTKKAEWRNVYWILVWWELTAFYQFDEMNFMKIYSVTYTSTGKGTSQQLWRATILVTSQVARESCCPKPEWCCPKIIVMSPKILSHTARNIIENNIIEIFNSLLWTKLLILRYSFC